MVKTSGGQQQQ